MKQLPDVYAYIKLIESSTGKALPTGVSVDPRSCPSVIVRYVVVNDSNVATGNFTVVGKLIKDGVPVQPAPLNKQLVLQAKEVFTLEYPVPTTGIDLAQFDVSMLADIGNFNIEESEQNNKATAMFKVFDVPR